MVPEERLELSRLAARDFESRMFTNFITPALVNSTTKPPFFQFESTFFRDIITALKSKKCHL